MRETEYLTPKVATKVEISIEDHKGEQIIWVIIETYQHYAGSPRSKRSTNERGKQRGRSELMATRWDIDKGKPKDNEFYGLSNYAEVILTAGELIKRTMS